MSYTVINFYLSSVRVIGVYTKDIETADVGTYVGKMTGFTPV